MTTIIVRNTGPPRGLTQGIFGGVDESSAKQSPKPRDSCCNHCNARGSRIWIGEPGSAQVQPSRTTSHDQLPGRTYHSAQPLLSARSSLQPLRVRLAKNGASWGSLVCCPCFPGFTRQALKVCICNGQRS